VTKPNPSVLSPLSASARTCALEPIERQAPLRQRVKLLFAGELLVVLVFSLSLRAPRVDTGVALRGYGKKKEYAAMRGAEACASFALVCGSCWSSNSGHIVRSLDGETA
jgi:hypothetical protein